MSPTGVLAALLSLLTWAVLAAERQLQFSCEDIQNTPSSSCVYQCAKTAHCVGVYEDEQRRCIIVGASNFSSVEGNENGRACWNWERVDKADSRISTDSPTLPPPKNCTADWVTCEACNSCVKIVRQSMILSEAETNCQLLGARLIEVKSQQIQNWLQEYLINIGEGGGNFWIGLSNEVGVTLDPDVWFWMGSGEPAVYTNWESAAPANRGAATLIRGSENFLWIDNSKSAKRSSVCEMMQLG